MTAAVGAGVGVLFGYAGFVVSLFFSFCFDVISFSFSGLLSCLV